MKKFVVTVIAALTLNVSPAAFAQDATNAPPAYMIGSYDIHDEAGFQDYIEAAAPLVDQYGGHVIVFNREEKPIIEGEPRSVIAIAEFPSLAEAKRYYNSPEYTAARQLFTNSTEGWRIITEGAGLPQQ